MLWVVIGVGGGLGAMARHGLNHVIARWAVGSPFLYGIFLINIVGSALIGLVAGLLAGSRLELSNEARTFVVVGLLGGFTTFSSFSLDTLTLLRGPRPSLALVNIAGQVGLSLLATAAGYRAGLGS